jgi:hypothetical protein
MGTRDIFITGHGGYRVARGIVTVPEKCEVRFYVTHGCTMNAATMNDMLKNATIQCHDDDAGTTGAIEIFKQRTPVPDMTLRPLNSSSSAEEDRNCFAMGKTKLARRGIEAQLLVPWSKTKLAEFGVDLSLSWIMRKVLNHTESLKNERYDSFRFHWLCCRSITQPKKQQPSSDDPFADVVLKTWS